MVEMKIQLLVIHLVFGLSSVQGCTNGAERRYNCVRETCESGNWVPHPKEITTACKTCTAEGDPHFTTFSEAKFDWHDPCNYALVQSDSSTTPKFGVFMKFETYNTVAVVGTPTIYQDDRNTQVVIHDKKNILRVEVNGITRQVTSDTPTLLSGQSKQTSVYAWKSGSCLRLYGSSKILVEFCSAKITIWAPKKSGLFPYDIGGLCGNSDGTSKMLIDRNGVQYNAPGTHGGVGSIAKSNFAESWKAHNSFQNCPTSRKRKSSERDMRSLELQNQCAKDAESLVGEFHDLCLGVHVGNGGTGDDHLGACKFDLCMVANGSDFQKAGLKHDWALDLHKEIHARTKLHHQHTIGHCEESSFRHNHDCFLVVDDKMSWHDARLYCEAEGYYLAEPENMTVLIQYLQEEDSHDDYWLGGSDAGTEGKWLWLSGRPITEEFIPNEPNGHHVQNCLDFRSDRTPFFADFFCHFQQKFICQK